MKCSGVMSLLARPLHPMPLMMKMGVGSRNLNSIYNSNIPENHLYENVVLSVKQGWRYVTDAGQKIVADVL
jgi:hypothetical protein